MKWTGGVCSRKLSLPLEQGIFSWAMFPIAQNDFNLTDSDKAIDFLREIYNPTAKVVALATELDPSKQSVLRNVAQAARPMIYLAQLYKTRKEKEEKTTDLEIQRHLEEMGYEIDAVILSMSMLPRYQATRGDVNAVLKTSLLPIEKVPKDEDTSNIGHNRMEVNQSPGDGYVRSKDPTLPQPGRVPFYDSLTSPTPPPSVTVIAAANHMQPHSRWASYSFILHQPDVPAGPSYGALIYIMVSNLALLGSLSLGLVVLSSRMEARFAHRRESLQSLHIDRPEQSASNVSRLDYSSNWAKRNVCAIHLIYGRDLMFVSTGNFHVRHWYFTVPLPRALALPPPGLALMVIYLRECFRLDQCRLQGLW
ncbi:hypothetical protein BU15DRAFT_67841 [Melanogaster broomeanus]|nr:hypothetical protein BU15DRAFT_67841 [Melanogaster broomeanus]